MNKAPAKSSALDPIPTWLLKRLTTYIAPVICRLCNMSLETGTFPLQLKQAWVTPLLKKPNLDQDTTSSYRPISNLSYLSKIIERVVVSRFTKHTSKFNLFPVHQSAYRPFHSTETAVLSVHNDLVRSIDNGMLSPLILLDLSSAFDTVDHQTLLSILSDRFGLQNTAINWFQSYLSQRSQTFNYAGQQSQSFPVDCSVPQGSVLGPLGFISYTEDLPSIFNKHDINSHMYADDTQAYTSCRLIEINNTRIRLANCVADVARWCASRRLQLNASKTEVIWFGSRSNLQKLYSQDSSLQIGSETIQPVNCARVLGVHLDDELSMKPHVAKTASSCFYQLRRLRQIRRRVGTEVTERLVAAFITSRLDYCNALLAALPQSTLEPLQRVQNAAARLIFELGQREHVSPCLMQLHWLPVKWRIKFKLCTIMHSIYNGRCPTYLSNIVEAKSLRPSRPGLRSEETSDYKIPRLKTKRGERAFSYAGPTTWNSLPVNLRTESESKKFRKLLKTHFFTAAFNCI
jgi:hypothetical protein